MTTFFEWLFVLVAAIIFCAPWGVRACSVMEARSEPPEVGVVQDVDKVPTGGLLGVRADIYLQIDDATYRYFSDDPVPVAGTTVEYKVDGDCIVDIKAVG